MSKPDRPQAHGPVSERFMRHHYGASGYVDPTKTVKLPDDVSVKMLENEAAVLRSALDWLVSAWRTRSGATDAVHHETQCTRRERYEAAGESRTYALCANELEAAIRKAAGERQQETER